MATHTPSTVAARLLFLPRLGAIQADKLHHLAAYAVLGLLARLAFLDRTAPRIRGVLPLFWILTSYAAIDEFTQPMFGRVGDLTDWAFDVIGVICGLGVGICIRAPRGVKDDASHPH